MNNLHELALIEFLKNDNKKLRNAGCKLAEAALRVATEYDGIHRLMLATSEWARAVADEGGRDKKNTKVSEKEFYRGWAVLASFIAGPHDEPSLIADAMKHHSISLADLENAGIDDFDMDILKSKLKEII